MADRLERRSPLAGMKDSFARASGAALAIREIPFQTLIDVRGDAADPAIRAAVRSTLKVDLPIAPNTVATGERGSLLWLGPDEWMVVAAAADPAVADELRLAVQGTHAAVVDVSASRTAIELERARSPELLSKGCRLDLHPRAFGPGRCAQTLLAQAEIVLHQVDARPTFQLYVRSSFATYLANWLLDATEEFRDG